jgi:hypothetical protein
MLYILISYRKLGIAIKCYNRIGMQLVIIKKQLKLDNQKKFEM